MSDPEGASDRRAARIDLAGTLHSVGLDRQRLVLWGITGLLLLGLWSFVRAFAGTLIVGLFVYYVTRPVFDRISRRVPGRTTAVVIAILTVSLPTLLLIGWTLAVLVQAVTDFAGSAAGDQVVALLDPYVDIQAELQSVDAVVRTALENPQQTVRELGPLVSTVTDSLVAALVTVGSVALQAFVVLVVTFYLLRDDVRIAAWTRETFDIEDTVVERYLVRVDDDLQSIFFGNILNALATGLIAVVSYALLNVVAPDVVVIPQAALLGLLVGVASLVPAVGIKIVTWPLGIYLLGRSLLFAPDTVWFPALFFLVSFFVVDYIPDQLLRPYVSGRSLHVGAVMLAYLFGPILFGWYGIFLGPFLLAVTFEFGRIVLPWLAAGEPPPDSSPEATESSSDAIGDADLTDDETNRESERPEAERPESEPESELGSERSELGSERPESDADEDDSDGAA